MIATGLTNNRFRYFQSSGALSPADSTIYVFNDVPLTATTVANADRRKFQFQSTAVITSVLMTSQISVNGSSETVVLQLYNITDNSYQTIGNFTLDFGANASKTNIFQNLNISIDSTKQYCWAINCPAWVTNPTGWSCGLSANIQM